MSMDPDDNITQVSVYRVDRGGTISGIKFHYSRGNYIEKMSLF